MRRIEVKPGDRKNMRQVSKKRQALMRKVKPIRDGLRDEVGCCEICENIFGTLDVHEIGRGVHREACLGERCALLVVCRRCHEENLSYTDQWTEARQLAALAVSRPQDFDLARFLEITSPKAPKRIEMQDVLDWLPWDYLSKSDIAERMRVDRRSVQNWIEAGQLPAIDVRTAGATKPHYRVSWEDYLGFCKSRKVER